MSKRFYPLYFLSFALIITAVLSIHLKGASLNPLSTEVNAQEESYIVSQMGICSKDSNRSTCLKNAAREFLDKFSLSQIMEIFAKNEQKSELISSCHEASHYLGQEAYKKIGNVVQVFSQCNNSCLGGCFHGVVEGHFIRKNVSLNEENTQQIEDEVAKICGKEEDYKKPQAFTECFHGLGHALMFLTENDLLKSLKYCDVLDTLEHKEYCYTGSFMANVDGGVNSDHPSKYYKQDEPMYVCSIVEDKYLKMCYTYAVTQAFQGDVAYTIGLCAQIPKPYRGDCYRTFGRDRVNGPTTDVSVMKGQCDQIVNSDYRLNCYQGLSWSLMIRYGPISTLPADFCHIVDEASKDECYTQVFNATKKWTRDERQLKKACENVTDTQYRDKCLKGI